MVANSKKTISTRVTPEVEKFLSEVFGTPSAGLSLCTEIVSMAKKKGINPEDIVNSLEFLKQIRLYSMREIKGKFTSAEWCYFADSLNGTMITPEFRANKQALIASVDDSNDFDNLAEKWKVDTPSFVNKINGLTGAQIDAIYTHVENFWNKEERDLYAWTEEL